MGDEEEEDSRETKTVAKTSTVHRGGGRGGCSTFQSQPDTATVVQSHMTIHGK